MILKNRGCKIIHLKTSCLVIFAKKHIYLNQPDYEEPPSTIRSVDMRDITGTAKSHVT